MALTYYQLLFTGLTITLNAFFIVCLVASYLIKRSCRRKSVLDVFGDLAENTPPNRCAKYTALFLDIFGAFCFSVFLMLLASFEYIPWYGSGIIITIFLLIYWGFKSNFFLHLGVACGWLKPSKQLYEDLEDAEGFSFMITDSPFAKKSFEPKKKLFRLMIRQLIPMLLVCGAGFALSWMNSNLCVAWEPMEVSTRFWRILEPDFCEKTFPCHLYAVLGLNGTSEVVIHFHTGRRYSKPMVVYDTVSHRGEPVSAYRFAVDAEEYYLDNLEVPRYIYYAYISGLTPNQTYYFIAGNFDGSEGQRTAEKHIQMPSEDSLRFVTGGDMGQRTATNLLSDQLLTYEADFVALGGDLAYDNAIPACYRRFDFWLALIQQRMATAAGKLTPLIFAIGNHCAGGFTHNPDAFTFFKPYFVHEPLNGRSPKELKTYRTHRIGNLAMIVLDSDIIERPDGTQAEWLEGQLKELSENPSIRWKTALYHVPMWPSVRSESDSAVTATRAAWSPIFDKYQLHIGFENHDHSYKRTKPIRDQKVAADGKGTIYLGDGSWGVTPREPARRDYLEVAMKETFFFYMSVNETAINGKAINVNGQAFDEFVISN